MSVISSFYNYEYYIIAKIDKYHKDTNLELNCDKVIDIIKNINGDNLETIIKNINDSSIIENLHFNEYKFAQIFFVTLFDSLKLIFNFDNSEKYKFVLENIDIFHIKKQNKIIHFENFKNFVIKTIANKNKKLIDFYQYERNFKFLRNYLLSLQSDLIAVSKQIDDLLEMLSPKELEDEFNYIKDECEHIKKKVKIY